MVLPKECKDPVEKPIKVGWEVSRDSGKVVLTFAGEKFVMDVDNADVMGTELKVASWVTKREEVGLPVSWVTKKESDVQE